MSADFAGGLVVVADHDSLSVGIVYGEEKLMTVFLGQAGPPCIRLIRGSIYFIKWSEGEVGVGMSGGISQK